MMSCNQKIAAGDCTSSSYRSAAPRCTSRPQRRNAAGQHHHRTTVLVVANYSSNPSPPDAPKDKKFNSREWLGTLLSRFGPVREKAQVTATLEFEKPLLELDKRIKEVGVEPYVDFFLLFSSIQATCLS